MTAVFDLPRVKKDDMHVGFRGDRLVVSWRVVRVTEREEPTDADGNTRIVRELEHKKYSRTIPLPDGTKVCPNHLESRLGKSSSQPPAVRADPGCPRWPPPRLDLPQDLSPSYWHQFQ
jgi:hypothetical protein